MVKKISVLYEDEDVLVLNKPAGLVVHPDGKTKEPTLVDWLIENYPDIQGVGEPLILPDGTSIDRPGIVHRLDRDTSGVIVIAKNQEAFVFLKTQFHDRTIAKTYFAFVWGEFKEERGIIDRPIGRSVSDFRQWSAGRGARGELRKALTHFAVKKKGKGISYVEVWPKTGRTHQIRVHFKSINHPVVGDKRYAEERESALGFKRVALHAGFLEFNTPNGKRLRIEAPLPKDFQNALKELEG